MNDEKNLEKGPETPDSTLEPTTPITEEVVVTPGNSRLEPIEIQIGNQRIIQDPHTGQYRKAD